uniref:Tyrosyl-DNA phosphodiesterase 1 n=1 Tax=Eptatretus burgeri TaxID=7764 RepID=A0A8C4QSH8_EPTBU
MRGSRKSDDEVKRKRLPRDRDSQWNLSASDESDVEPPVKSSQQKRKKLRDLKVTKVTSVERRHEDSLLHSPCEDVCDVLQRGAPFNFFLTRVEGIEGFFNSGALHLTGTDALFSECFNYCFDVPWFVGQYPHEFRIWLSPLFPRLQPDSKTSEGESWTGFKADLLAYLFAYHFSPVTEWATIVEEHDLSEARVFLVASVPGRHVGSSKDRWGHLSLRKILHEWAGPITVPSIWPVVAQFSSIGSLGTDSGKWLTGELLDSLSAMSGQKAVILNVLTFDINVAFHILCHAAGGSLPYGQQTAEKQQWLRSYLHRWMADVSGRTRAMPHIKTYLRMKPDCSQISWFLVTSANLSKAAWGALEKSGTQLMIRSYELGVLFLPRMFVSSCTLSTTLKNLVFPVPFDLPIHRYREKDRPWIWNIPYVHAPDSHGNMWVPS